MHIDYKFSHIRDQNGFLSSKVRFYSGDYKMKINPDTGKEENTYVRNALLKEINMELSGDKASLVTHCNANVISKESKDLGYDVIPEQAAV